MKDNKINIYDKDITKQELINYCEKLEYKLEQNDLSRKQIGNWPYYVIFLFSFLLGGAVIRAGMEYLKGKNFEWYLLIIFVLVLSPIVYLFIKTINNE